jgi:hypothetical protein
MDRSVMVETPNGVRVGGVPYVSDGAIWLRDERKISRCLGMLPEDIPQGLRAALRAYGDSEAESVGRREDEPTDDVIIANKLRDVAKSLGEGMTAREFREADADAYRGADNPKEYRVVVVGDADARDEGGAE